MSNKGAVMKRTVLTVLCVCMLGCGAFAQEQQNLLRNGSFDGGTGPAGIPLYWGSIPYSQDLVTPGYNGEHALKISRTATGDSIGAQVIPLSLPGDSTIVVFGMIKGSSIERGDKAWQGAKVQVIFLDQNERELGAPLDVARYDGTFDWEMFIRDVTVPAGTNSCKVLIGLWGAQGEVWFDDLGIFEVAKKVNPFSKVNNLLSDGDFESWGKWDLLGDGELQVKYPGASDSSQAMYITNARPVWTFAVQRVPLIATATTLNLSGKEKHTNIVPGKEAWEKGRVYCAFSDEHGAMLGSWIELLAVDGTSDWSSFSKEVPVPHGAVAVTVYAGLQNATGEIVFDDLQLVK